jgi:coenzyme F420-reducing hydrogenase delta subunit
MLRAFETGADGIMLVGCQSKQCQYGQCGDNLEKEYKKAGEILKLLGINSKRITLARLAPFDGKGIKDMLNEFITVLEGITLTTKKK